ncbi:ABC transporter permease [Cohnella herbarum]|uniref:ABC transporter permease n=1 Tax=Cohnella herbarum TaxID=2728023 RepID=A0A7Z2ZLG6_9BACL|nr:ABC transporter permease subunit [Cohnella herbarum]QJD83032.1 ABC transporter permease [Cohnella herbarum]
MNKTLLAGLLITAIMIAVALFGGYFAPHDLKDQVKIEYIVNDQGKGEVIAPPVRPGSNYPFGTDKNGYDLMAKLMDGAKYTIFLSVGIAFMRVFIGGMLGMLLGYFRTNPAGRLRAPSSWNFLNGIPIFLIFWLMLIGISINPSLSPLAISILMGAVLTVVGLPSVVSSIKDKTSVIRDRAFVVASQSIGAGHWKIIRSHLFPHLKESFLIMTVQEVILVLTLFGQLAIFNLFVGGTTMNFDPAEYFSRTNEWGGLIGQARNSMYLYSWILFIPLASYMLLITGFHLVSNGLEALYKKRYAKFSHF